MVSDSPRELISQLSVQRSLHVREDWSHFRFETETSELEYQYRVVCDSYYYGAGCQDMCKPRDDMFGHYQCSENGTMICREGWSGMYCDLGGCMTTLAWCLHVYRPHIYIYIAGQSVGRCLYMMHPWENCPEHQWPATLKSPIIIRLDL